MNVYIIVRKYVTTSIHIVAQGSIVYWVQLLYTKMFVLELYFPRSVSSYAITWARNGKQVAYVMFLILKLDSYNRN